MPSGYSTSSRYNVQPRSAAAIRHQAHRYSMSARIIDGKAIAAKIKEEQKQRILRLQQQHGVRPGLAVILVGNDPASQVYVRNKVTACKLVGIHSELVELPQTATQDQLLSRIDALNTDPTIHGILLQLQLP